MTTINSLLNSTTVLYENDGNIKEISEMVKELSDEERNNYAMRFMYNEWMQKVLLSDGLDPDENYDW
ncbi:hypothetical protein [Symbiopectobacterium purcellii]|uniref:Uncharacterized protein n=1 Tax=Symbiopectobacterium purcellii TaxID=2871826 RepID=A0ABX9AL48_9ENTR|nr:hypothetical protein [Symbiopectobacterium purcellii]QZN94791.1 hypothetical protein K6K13_16180 [Symbiopectobacterium purcellii]